MSQPFVCPYPLVWANASLPIEEHLEVHWAYEAGNCAVRCPSIAFTESEMSTFYDHIKWISGVSCIVSTVILLYYIRDVEKRFLMVMFLIGFWLESVGLFFFLPLNKNNHVICDGDAYYVPEAPECVMQSFMLIYSFIWVMTWGAIYAVDIYFQVQFKMGAVEIKKYRRRYFIFVLLATTVTASVPLGAGNLGYDYTTSLQMCLYLFGDHQAYFWLTLVLPFSVMLFASFFFSILTFKRLHHIFVHSQLRQNKSQSKSQRGRAPSDVDSAQDDYSQRMRFNYWSSDDALDNDFDSDGKVTIKSTIVNPLSIDGQAVLELSNSNHSYGKQDKEAFSSTEEEKIQEELVEARQRAHSRPPAHQTSYTSSDTITHELRLSENDVGRPSSADTRATSSGPQQTDVSSPTTNQKFQKISNLLICLKKTWKYNGRMILFLFFFCTIAIFILPTLVYLFYNKYDQYVLGTEDYVKCLVTASQFSPGQAQEEVDSFAQSRCGTHPSDRPPIPIFMSVSYWAATFGLIPLLLFGKAPFNYLMKKFAEPSASTNTNTDNSAANK